MKYKKILTCDDVKEADGKIIFIYYPNNLGLYAGTHNMCDKFIEIKKAEGFDTSTWSVKDKVTGKPNNSVVLSSDLKPEPGECWSFFFKVIYD